MRDFLINCLFLFLLSLPVPALAAEEIIVRGMQGETRVTIPPHTVATLDVASLDTLAAIGVDPSGVPNTPLPPYLARFKEDRYRKVGSLFEPDYEQLAAMAPNLIILGGRSASKFRDVSRIAPTIDLTPDWAHRIASDLEHAEILGRIFHKEARVRDLVLDLKAAIEVVRTKMTSAGTGLLIMTTGGRLSVVGPGSWFATLYHDLGLRPAAKLDGSMHGQVISSEFLLEIDPDWLFVIDRDAAIGQGGSTARQVLDNDVVHQTKAWKTGRVVYLDPVSWYVVGDGLTSLRNMVRQVDEALDSGRP